MLADAGMEVRVDANREDFLIIKVDDKCTNWAARLAETCFRFLGEGTRSTWGSVLT
jgi:hypothetical protein